MGEPRPTGERTAELRRRLEAAGLHPPADEIEAMASIFGALAADIEAMYDLPAARYEPPALRFTAGDPNPEWRA